MITWSLDMAFPASSLCLKLTNAQYFSAKQRTVTTSPNLSNTQ